VIAVVSSPLVLLLHCFTASKLYTLYIGISLRALVLLIYDVCFLVRGVLGGLNVVSMHYFRKGVEKVFGKPVSALVAILTAIQFHLPFYASRTLPNSIALPLGTLKSKNMLHREINTCELLLILCVLLCTITWTVVTLGYWLWLSGRYWWMMLALVFTTVVFRSELIILAGPIILQECFVPTSPSFRKQSTMQRLLTTIVAGIAFAIFSLGTTLVHWLIGSLQNNC
jgi:hypothetical protein